MSVRPSALKSPFRTFEGYSPPPADCTEWKVPLPRPRTTGLEVRQVAGPAQRGKAVAPAVAVEVARHLRPCRGPELNPDRAGDRRSERPVSVARQGPERRIGARGDQVAPAVAVEVHAQQRAGEFLP